MDYETDIHLERLPLEESAEFHTKRGMPLPLRVTGRAANVAQKKRNRKEQRRERMKALTPAALVRKVFPAKSADETESQMPETVEPEQATC